MNWVEGEKHFSPIKKYLPLNKTSITQVYAKRFPILLTCSFSALLPERWNDGDYNTQGLHFRLRSTLNVIRHINLRTWWVCPMLQCCLLLPSGIIFIYSPNHYYLLLTSVYQIAYFLTIYNFKSISTSQIWLTNSVKNSLITYLSLNHIAYDIERTIIGMLQSYWWTKHNSPASMGGWW